MTKRYSYLLGLVLMVAFLASCSTSKSVKKSHSIEGMTETEFVET